MKKKKNSLSKIERNKEERNLICTGSLSSMKTRNLQSVDSGTSNGLFRYQREIFIDMVLDELLVNKKYSKKEDTVQMKRHLDPAHVTQSNTMYVARKQAKHEDALKKAKALEGCTLELLGDARVTVVVKMAQIVWGCKLSPGGCNLFPSPPEVRETTDIWNIWRINYAVIPH